VLIGGQDLRDAVKRLGNELLGHDLQLRFNWTGQRGWKAEEEEEAPVKFQGTELAKIMTSKYDL